MSYCRFGEGSDVYVIRSADRLVCFCSKGGFACAVGEEQQMIDHLARHEAAGDLVPYQAIRRLESERDGIPFMTEVELALDTIGLESPEDLLQPGVADEDESR